MVFEITETEERTKKLLDDTFDIIKGQERRFKRGEERYKKLGKGVKELIKNQLEKNKECIDEMNKLLFQAKETVKKIKEKNEQNHKKILKLQDLIKKQKIINYFILGGFILVVSVLSFLFMKNGFA